MYVELFYTICLLGVFTPMVSLNVRHKPVLQEDADSLQCCFYFVFVIVSFSFPGRKYDPGCSNQITHYSFTFLG